MTSIPSSALEFQIELTEVSQKNGKNLTADRTNRCFQIFENLIPQMGVYKRLFEIIYSELFASVYSSEFSTGESKLETFNVPYFALYQTLERNKDNKIEDLLSYIESLQDNIKEKEESLDNSAGKVEELSGIVESLQREKLGLENQLVDLSDTIRRLDANFKEFVNQKKISDSHYEDEMFNLQTNLDRSALELNKLQPYESLYRGIQEAFVDPGLSPSKLPVQTVAASNKNSVLVDLKSCQTLERQLFDVQNSLIEELDAYMESYKSKMQSMTLAKSFRDPNFDKDEKLLSSIDQELFEKQNVFKRSMTEIAEEMEHLKIHKESLEINHDRIKQEEEEKAKDMAVKNGGVINDAPLSEAEKAALETVFDKLDAQEQMTSKYSAIIYFSNNRGQTFYELPQNTYCQSCGTKTLVCPHKIAKDNWVIELPPNTSLLRISRPKLKLQKKLDDREIEALFAKQLKQATVAKDHLKDEKVQQAEVLEEESDGEEAGQEEQIRLEGKDDPEEKIVGRPISSGSSDVKHDALYFARIQDIQEGLRPITQKLPSQFSIVWSHYRSHTDGFLRLYPRLLSLDRTKSLMEQFFASLLWSDRSIDTTKILTLAESLHEFFDERFMLKEASNAALFDFLSSLQAHADTNMEILMLVQCLAGEINSCNYRYLLLIGNLINLISWDTLNDLYFLLHAAYPFLPAEDCDNFALDYVAFSKNSLSASIVSQFFYYITLKKKDPRANNSEILLCQYPVADPGFLTEGEFAVACNEILPTHNTALRQRLFKQSLKSSKGAPSNKVPFETLVEVLSYLDLLEVFEVAKKMLSSGKRGERQTEYPKGLKVKLLESENENILSHEKLLKLANNFSQRERSRVMRQMQASLDKAAKSSSKPKENAP